MDRPLGGAAFYRVYQTSDGRFVSLAGNDRALAGFLLLMVKYVAPVTISLIWVFGIFDRYFAGG